MNDERFFFCFFFQNDYCSVQGTTCKTFSSNHCIKKKKKHYDEEKWYATV